MNKKIDNTYCLDNGGAYRIRTYDPRLKRPVLYRAELTPQSQIVCYMNAKFYHPT